jgi:hypothetical protein
MQEAGLTSSSSGKPDEVPTETIQAVQTNSKNSNSSSYRQKWSTLDEIKVNHHVTSSTLMDCWYVVKPNPNPQHSISAR